MRNFLINLSEEKNVTIMISSHILAELEQLADYLGVIHHGKLLEEVSMETLRKKNRKYLEFQVSNEKKAVVLLERHFGIDDYQVHENGQIRIYSHLGQQGLLNKVFVENDIEVTKIVLSEDKLEDYFVRLIGGGLIG